MYTCSLSHLTARVQLDYRYQKKSCINPSQSWISQYKCFGVNVLQMLQKDIDALKIIHYLTEIQT